MGSLSMEFAVMHDLLVGASPFAIGVLMVVALIVAVVIGRRWWLREPPPPKAPQPRAGAWHTREEYGGQTPDDHGPGHQDADPVGYENATRDPEEMPQDDRRRLPHEIRPYPGPRT